MSQGVCDIKPTNLNFNINIPNLQIPCYLRFQPHIDHSMALTEEKINLESIIF